MQTCSTNRPWAARADIACIARLRAFVDAGATTITLRLTGYDQERQFDRVTREVLPAFAAEEKGRG